MRTKTLASGAAALCLSEVVIAVVLVVTLGWNWQETLDSIVLSNGAIGISFGLCGTLIAWHRPRHPIGWMYALGGTLQAATALTAPLAAILQNHGAPTWLVRLDLTVFNNAWPWYIGVLLPLSLFLFPDGHLPSPRWRPIFAVLVMTSPLFVIEIGASPQTFPGLPEPFLTVADYDALAPLWLASELRWAVSMLLGLGCLVVRFHRGDEVQRRQLLWLLAAGAVVVLAVVPWALVAGTPITVLFAIPLIPVSITVAVLRHQLLDIRLVVARGSVMPCSRDWCSRHTRSSSSSFRCVRPRGGARRPSVAGPAPALGRPAHVRQAWRPAPGRRPGGCQCSVGPSPVRGQVRVSLPLVSV